MEQLTSSVVVDQLDTERLIAALPCVAPYCVPGGVRVVSNGVSDSGVAAFSDGTL